MGEPKKDNVTQMPNQPTHTVVPVDLMGEVMAVLTNKMTWAEVNPLMMKIQQNVEGAVQNEDGTFSVLTPPPGS